MLLVWSRDLYPVCNSLTNNSGNNNGNRFLDHECYVFLTHRLKSYWKVSNVCANFSRRNFAPRRYTRHWIQSGMRSWHIMALLRRTLPSRLFVWLCLMKTRFSFSSLAKQELHWNSSCLAFIVTLISISLVLWYVSYISHFSAWKMYIHFTGVVAFSYYGMKLKKPQPNTSSYYAVTHKYCCARFHRLV